MKVRIQDLQNGELVSQIVTLMLGRDRCQALDALAKASILLGDKNGNISKGFNHMNGHMLDGYNYLVQVLREGQIVDDDEPEIKEKVANSRGSRALN